MERKEPWSWRALELKTYGSKSLVSKQTPACSVEVLRLCLTYLEGDAYAALLALGHFSN